ncbi:hypothetical protein B0J18DRAFT_406351 [Chaetomium sp. MPI-SDFR-AT-0129]|nr:hypothetical protein B0J18DRAFT_406351 [Chaetomium sp. MPI-SDFR-AT-0129]
MASLGQPTIRTKTADVLRRLIPDGKANRPTTPEAALQPSLPRVLPVADEGGHASTSGPGETNSQSVLEYPSPGPSLAATPSKERFGLFEFPAEGSSQLVLPNARHVDIVAVHGLGGHWKNTWTGDDGAIWLRDRLPDLLAESNIAARIRSFGYDSAIVLSRSVGDLPTAGRSLLMRLRGFRKTQQQRNSPIIFICHSLGGLVVKEALVHAWNHSSQNQDILEKVKGCVFLGVPHRGSGLADWAKVAADVAKGLSLGFAGNNHFIGLLKENSKDWVKLSDSFVERADNLFIRSFYETDKYGNVIVVDESSAAMHIRNEVLFPLEGSNHRTICKFRANEHQRFSPIGDAVVELAELALPSAEELERQSFDVRCLELLPISTNTFVGREQELKVIEDLLNPGKPGQNGVVLYGMPGAGKSQLALRYIEKHRKLFTSIFWITASSTETTSSSFSDAANLISSSWPAGDLPNTYYERDNQKMVISRLRSTIHKSWLLVIDSADDLQGQDLTQCVPHCHHGSILVTSIRREAADVFDMESQEVASLDPESSKQLFFARLRNRSGEVSTSAEDEDLVKAIVKELDHLPLPIEHAAALIQLNRFTLENFLDGYQQHYRRLSAERVPKGLLKYEKGISVFTLIELLYSTIREESPEAAALLTLLAFLGPWRFNLAMFQRPDTEEIPTNSPLASFDNSHLKAVLTNNISLLLAVSHLRDACLVKAFGDARSPESISVHNIICQWLFEAVSEKEPWILAAAETLSASACLSQESLVQKHIRPTDLAVPDGRYASVQMDLKSSFAFTNLFVSRLKPAQEDFQQAIEYLQLQQKGSWPSGKVALYLLYGLATTYHRVQDTEKATAVLDDVLVLALNIFEEGDPRTAEIHSRAKAVAERASLNLRHHKAALLASTAGGSQKVRRGVQCLDTSSATADGSPTGDYNEVPRVLVENDAVNKVAQECQECVNMINRTAWARVEKRADVHLRVTELCNGLQVTLCRGDKVGAVIILELTKMKPNITRGLMKRAPTSGTAPSSDVDTMRHALSHYTEAVRYMETARNILLKKPKRQLRRLSSNLFAWGGLRPRDRRIEAVHYIEAVRDALLHQIERQRGSLSDDNSDGGELTRCHWPLNVWQLGELVPPIFRNAMTWRWVDSTYMIAVDWPKAGRDAGISGSRGTNSPRSDTPESNLSSNGGGTSGDMEDQAGEHRDGPKSEPTAVTLCERTVDGRSALLSMVWLLDEKEEEVVFVGGY